MISPETLRRFALFAGIAPAHFKDLAMAGEEVNLEEGEWVFREGDEADALYLVVSGTIALKIALDASGERQADLETLVAGEVLGWSALVEPYQYTLGAVATSRASLVKLDAARLRKLLEDNPQLGFQIMTRLASVIGDRLKNLRVRFVSLVAE